MFITRVIKSLNKAHVGYAVIGGYAVALHGAIRGTVDIDLVVKIDKSQFVAAEKALRSIGLQSRLPVSAIDVFEFRDEYINNKNMKAWSFYNPANPLEIVDILIIYDLSKMQTITKKIDRLNIQVISISDLISIKKQAGRPQDIEDIKALEKLR